MSTIREVKIPVPWGHIAGRESGPPAGRPLLMLHGWLDNCGTFDYIQPHLPAHFHCVNIDIPGHGLSSHKPAGMTYHMMDAVTFIRLIREHFGWRQFSLLGHSMGAAMAVLYAAAFPEDVRSLITVDLVKQITRPVDQHVAVTRDAVLGYVSTQQKLAGPRPQYQYDELRRRLMTGVGLEDPAHAECLLARGARRDPHTGLYQYTYDLRHRLRGTPSFSFEQWAAYAGQLRCRLLVLLAEAGGTWIGAEEEAAALDVYRRAVPELRLHRVPGGHHVHLTHPQHVLPIICRFMEEEAASPHLPSQQAADGDQPAGSRL